LIVIVTSISGPSVDQYASSFARRSRDVIHDRTAYEAQKEALGDDFYSDVSTASVSTFKPDSARVDAMVAELDKQGQKRREFHRRRAFKEEKDITFINEANRKFNKQLEKQYGKATAAIKESLERGSAL
jgi:pre-mRNA-splicing factor SYF2